jgi:glycine cleavage system aminomethyltransferase T
VGPLASAAAGAAVLDGNAARIGEVTSITQTEASSVALAYLKRAHSELMTRVRIGDADWEVRYVVGASDAGCPVVAST